MGHVVNLNRDSFWAVDWPVPSILLGAVAVVRPRVRESSTTVARRGCESRGSRPRSRSARGNRPGAQDRAHRGRHDGEPFVRQHPRAHRSGDGFTLGHTVNPRPRTPTVKATPVHAFHMPTECQTKGVGNDWKVTHEAYDNGTCQGFVDEHLGRVDGLLHQCRPPLHVRNGKDFPHRRSLLLLDYGADHIRTVDIMMAGTSLGLTTDTFPSELPPNGVIFQQFDKHGITWKDYYSTLPSIGIFLPLLESQTLSAWSGEDRRVLCRCRGGEAPFVQSRGARLLRTV